MRKLLSFIAPLALLGAAFGAMPAHAAQPVTLSNDRPNWVSKAQNLGAADASQTIDFTVWLNLQHENQLAAQVQSMYTKGNANYHKFLSNAQFQATYSPPKGNVNAVTQFLQNHGFTIVDTAENNFYVKAEGTIGQVEQAFHVQINNYKFNGQTYRSNAQAPQVDNTMNGVIADITGLDNSSDFRPDLVRPALLENDGTSPSTAVAWNVVCGNFNTTNLLNIYDKTTGASLGTQSYTGFIPCGYGATQLERAYGVDQVCHLSGTYPNVTYTGNCGQGQSVAITDAYGSPTILQDANWYSQAYNLPTLVNGQNFQLVTPAGIVNKPESRAQDPLGWQAEVTLDVEMVHAMAPAAKIVLVASPNNYADLDEAVNWVVIHHLANIVTDSWGLPFDLASPGKASRDERIFMQAAAEGIGVNFSSGDCGDETTSPASDSQCGGAKSADYPATSPWVTAVGGTSLFLNGYDGTDSTTGTSYGFETGWGTHIARVYSCYSSVKASNGLKTCTGYYSRPLDEAFQGGAGGGLSYNFSAQPWQSAISGDNAAGFGTVGTHRALPDVSMLADPYTGAKVYIHDLTAGGSAQIEPYGGTSVASPMFAGIMALVDEARAANGRGPAGLASQYLYNLPSGAVTDVSNPPANTGNAAYDGVLNSFSLFYGSRYSGTFFNVAFNQDSSLSVGSGWDDVTGVGTPNAPSFVSALQNAG